jgi:hypothetical protein
MKRYEHLRGFLRQFNCLTEPEINLISSRFGQTSLKKDEYYFKTGACCCHLSYLDDGVLCVLAPSAREEEAVRYFVTENHFFTDPDGFKPGGCACTSFQAMVPCTLLSIPLCEAEELYREVPAFTSVVHQIREQSLIDIIKHQDFVLTEGPTGQYLLLLYQQIKHPVRQFSDGMFF